MIDEVLPKLVFLPGAIGAAEFWHAVGGLLPDQWEKVYLSWPGLGAQPAVDVVQGFDDLVDLVERELDRPSVLVAQSMGGIVAVRVALRQPVMVERLVLAATSGGVDVRPLGASEWRDDYRRNHPGAAAWVSEERPDLTEEIRMLRQPTLLLWGDADPVSPVAVGEHLRALVPHARLELIRGGTHSFAADHPQAVACLIEGHLRRHVED